MTRQFRQRLRWSGSTFVAGLFGCFAVQVSDAAPLVKRSADGVRIEAREARVQEVLTLLERDFGVQYRTSISLDRTLSGAYEGPLLPVLGRILRGYDYVITSRQGAIEVVILSLERTEAKSTGTVQPPGGSQGVVVAPGAIVPDRPPSAGAPPAAAVADPPPNMGSGRATGVPSDSSVPARASVPPSTAAQVTGSGPPPPPPAVETQTAPVSPLPGAMRPGQR